MRHELVHRLTHVGRRHPAASLPGAGRFGRAGALARAGLRALVVAALGTAATLGVALAAAALAAHPLAAWLGVVAATAAAPALARRTAASLSARA